MNHRYSGLAVDRLHLHYVVRPMPIAEMEEVHLDCHHSNGHHSNGHHLMVENFPLHPIYKIIEKQIFKLNLRFCEKFMIELNKKLCLEKFNTNLIGWPAILLTSLSTAISTHY